MIGDIAIKHYLIAIIALGILSTGSAWGTYYFNDGGSHIIDYVINDSVTISGPDTQVTLMDGGWVSEIVRVEYDGASFTMTGGYIGDWLVALSSSPVIITGGTIENRLSLDSYWPDGADGDVYIYGTDFQIDGIAVPYGTYHVSGHLNGTLANDDLMEVDFNCSGGNDLILMPIPEPGTLCLLALGSVALLRRRRA